MIGTDVGNHRVIGLLGEGSMGKVYVAEHRLIGHKVAIKVLHPEVARQPGVAERFVNEARAAARVRHVGLVNLHDCGTLPDGTTLLTMELLEGESLSARLRRDTRLDPALVAAIGRQLADALGAVHAAGIVHRDLKPDNVLLVPDADAPGGVRAKVLDFGVAKVSGGPGGVRTLGGAIMGTPAYMSPEQCRNAGTVDQRADVYALGCILYEVACGQPPFVRDGMRAVIAAHLTEAPAPPSKHAPLPRPLEAAILRAMAKRPDDRPATMADLAVLLGADEAPAARGARAISQARSPRSVPGVAPTPPRPAPTASSEAATVFSPQRPPALHGMEASLRAREARRRWTVRGVSAIACAAVLGGALWLLRGTTPHHAPTAGSAAVSAAAPR